MKKATRNAAHRREHRNAKTPSAPHTPTHRRKIGPASSALTLGQVKAVLAAFKAGITPARIARQFGLSHADVRMALSSDQ
jgi:hypothetical protein